MNRRLPLSALALCLAALFSSGCARQTTAPAAAASPALIPAPASIQEGEGRFRFDSSTPLFAGSEKAQTVATQFVALAGRSGLTVVRADRPGDPARDSGIHFVIDPAAAPDAVEGYVLDITSRGVRVAASDERGLFYGAVSLWQLLTSVAEPVVDLPALRIEDAPRFGWRGLMLDSSRHIQSVDEIKQLIDAMSLHKLNMFHWHLSDDQGWRVEIRKYPRLTEVGGCRIPAGEAGIDPVTGEPRPYCGFYTQAQIRDVVAYAAERHITVVPEFDMPGHVQAVVAAYPQYGSLGNQPPVSNEWGVHPYLFNVDEDTFGFIEDVLDEILALFPSTYIHIGGDEAVKDQWKASPRVQARMRELGIADEAALQSWFIKRLERYLDGKGRRLLGWDEILEGGLPPKATVMSWRGIEGGIAAATQGHDVVMAPWDKLYLDYLQTGSPNEEPGRPTQVTLETVYTYEPVPAELDDAQSRHVLGVQANVWTEHMRTWPRVQHAIFPRIAALAESAWSPRARRDYPDFLARLPAQLHRYRALGIHYAPTPFEVLAEIAADRSAATARVSLSNPLGYPIRYTTDGSEPDATSPPYTGAIDIELPARIRAAPFFNDRALAPATAHTIDTAGLLTRSDEQLRTCPDTGRLLLRLEDDGPIDGGRALYNVTIFYPCWLWPAADLADDIGALRVRLGRLPYYFQLAHDEPLRTFMPAETEHGELLVQSGGCNGSTLARIPLPAAPGEDGFLSVDVPVEQAQGSTDLCFTTTGDTRPAMWVLDRVDLVPR